jgi:isopentenyl diphosphate isomerase/L-lactate dehydrogenase-like FMN-dependent dehydrogenase
VLGQPVSMPVICSPTGVQAVHPGGEVENVLDILRGGIDSALLGLGKASIGDLTPDDIVVPPGFTRTLGG